MDVKESYRAVEEGQGQTLGVVIDRFGDIDIVKVESPVRKKPEQKGDYRILPSLSQYK
jgi:hypothetical protein